MKLGSHYLAQNVAQIPCTPLRRADSNPSKANLDGSDSRLYAGRARAQLTLGNHVNG